MSQLLCIWGQLGPLYVRPPLGLDPSIYFRHPTDVPPDELMGKTAPMT